MYEVADPARGVWNRDDEVAHLGREVRDPVGEVRNPNDEVCYLANEVRDLIDEVRGLVLGGDERMIGT